MGEAARTSRPGREIHARWVDAGSAGELRTKRNLIDKEIVVTAEGIDEEEGRLLFYDLREGVGAILAEDARLRAFVDETCAEIRDVFGADSELAIARYQDPEAPEDGRSLYLLVRTTLDAATAGRLLHRFDESWWIDNAPRGQGKLEVSLEFV